MKLRNRCLRRSDKGPKTSNRVLRSHVRLLDDHSREGGRGEEAIEVEDQHLMEEELHSQGAPVEEMDVEVKKSVSEESDSFLGPQKRNMRTNDPDPEACSSSASTEVEDVPAKKRRMAQTHLQTLKKTGEVFLQTKTCRVQLKYTSKVGKCLECSSAKNPKVDRKNRSVCRFVSFRKLRYKASGSLIEAGFLGHAECTPEDMKMWMPGEPPEGLTPVLAKYLLEQVGPQFCVLVHEEKETLSDVEGRVIVWRKPISQLRELCDVCLTTLFNSHRICGKCGFVVCTDCWKTRVNNVENVTEPSAKPKVGKDSFGWLKCKQCSHSTGGLEAAQIIAGEALNELNMKFLEVCKALKTPQSCCEAERTNGVATLPLAPECAENAEVRVEPKNQQQYVEVPRSLLCQGNLLRLLEPKQPGNIQLFQEHWSAGQPVIVSNVSKYIDHDLWSPNSFSRDFGGDYTDLVNCMSGEIVPKRRIKEFWDGFEHVEARLRDMEGEPMLLKLKDWPPTKDFADKLPTRFDDLMSALPLPEYTHRDGKLNLVARLPPTFRKPDLGPKMYIAYGSGLHLDKGTTNLHLDVSDAVNVLVYVGNVKDQDNTEHDKAILQAIEESGCDTLSLQRVSLNKEVPGALWHIWPAADADKIRDLLKKVAVEKGTKLEKHHDPIHDQNWYVDSSLRKRLREEYNVTGFPILQFEGDAVFIPAGAPHQVRNLNNCIKIAEDFVSPENVTQCVHLTNEFRNLTDAHTNHEDKLQIKNIVYHTVKDAVAVLQADADDKKC